MKISFSSLGRHGRLGNQLFQVASTLGLATKHGAQAVFPAWKYEPYFEIDLPHGDMQKRRIEEKFFHHYDWELKGDCDLLGYMQSEKYFGSTRLKFKEDVLNIHRKNRIFEKPTICIQVRRGDYVGNENYRQLTPNYYIDALLTHFPNWQDHNILFISDDIEYCRTHFECMPNAVFSMGSSDIQDMMLASCCDHFIISNSTFGWWCAWLGEKPHSRIIHSGDLFAGNLASNDSSDYYPEHWTGYQKDDYILPLQDVTFTIPVYMDHADRKHNLELGVCLLQKSFDTNILIGEQGGTSFEYMKQWTRYVRFEGSVFHRTKMLNIMCDLADTEYVANWDCDIFIPPMQLYMAMMKLRGGADMVFPFDGRFARMPRKPWFDLILKHLDVGIVRNEPFKGRVDGHNSVGGAVMFRKDSFIAGGMENEHMISFGPEDCERHDRFKLLGYEIGRVRGSLFHMNHYVGINSSPRNPYFKHNHSELEKIRGMSKRELRAYVDSWKWITKRAQYEKV